MTTTTNGVQVAMNSSFPSSTRIGIADLEDGHSDVSNSYIEATVSLVWPYSSSTRRFSLLLSEASTHPSKIRRQVKVTFHNGAAKAAQESRMGIGDTVRLSLEGCLWQRGQDEISTPGKRLEEDIEYRKTLILQVNPDTPTAKLVHYVWNGTPEPAPTPTVKSVIAATKSADITPSKLPLKLHSPTSRHSFRVSSGSFLNASLDPFAEDKDYVYGPNRKRTKFGRDSGTWRLLDSDDDHDPDQVVISSPIPAPPLQEKLPADIQAPLQQFHTPPDAIHLTSPIDNTLDQFTEPDQSANTLDITQPPDDQSMMPPPQTPARPLSKQEKHITLPDRQLDDTNTPRLHPMPSPGLPLVSPLVSRFGFNTPYFPSTSAPLSELDASSVSTRDRNGSVNSSSSDDSLIVVEPITQTELYLTEVQENGMAEPPDQEGREDITEDEDMYGAPENPTTQQVQDLPPKTALNVLDALEEFLDMSPTEPEPPKPLTEPIPPSQHSGPTTDLTQPSPDTSRSASAVPSMDGAYDDDEVPPPPYSILLEEGGPSSPIEQQQLGHAEAIELTSTSATPSSSPSPPVSASQSESVSASLEDEPEYSDEEPEYPDAEHSMTNADGEVVRMRDVTMTPDGSDTDESPQPAPSPALISRQSQPLEVSLLPTPEQTQEYNNDIKPGSVSHLDDVSHLPTPNQTQVDPETSLIQPPTSQPEEVEKVIEDIVQEEVETIKMDHEKSPRTSDRVSRKPPPSHNIQSPYFTPRNQNHSYVEEVSSAQHASSPAQDLPSSPIRQKRKPTPARGVDAIAKADKANGHHIEDFFAETPQMIRKTGRGKHTGLTTTIAYYTPLASLHEYFNQIVDIIVICAEDSTPPLRSETGPKDWHTTLRVADPSSDSSASSKQAVQIFRPTKAALPTAKRGDVIILRDFKVQMQNHTAFLLSTDSSAWAVFDGTLDERVMVEDASVTGPPLEYGRGETAYVKKIAGWWKDAGEEQFPDQQAKGDKKGTNDTQEVPDSIQLSTVNQEDDDAGVEEAPKSLRGTRQQQNLVIGTQPTTAQEAPLKSVEEPPKSPIRTRRQQKLADEGKEDDPPDTTSVKKHQAPSMTPSRRQPPRRARTPIPDTKDNLIQEKSSPLQPSPKTTRRTRATKSPSVVHELRDGTTYVDDTDGLPSQEMSPPQLARGSPKTTRRTRATKSPSTVHELRDGTQYIDGEEAQVSPPQQASTRTTRRTRATKSPTVVHELRDGTKYVDDKTEDKMAKMKDKEAVHELRGGRRYVDEE